ncbi:uncharacterized protein P884DRAFT_29187 [Thermothelomyces heterothallicus CBS 202.75]|uniref:uncharacterized protein n=1 Tax=Thermothelomyces heterothallicus CBS 202.75 TaxID=1149848 RepID=UPI00374333F4
MNCFPFLAFCLLNLGFIRTRSGDDISAFLSFLAFADVQGWSRNHTPLRLTNVAARRSKEKGGNKNGPSLPRQLQRAAHRYHSSALGRTCFLLSKTTQAVRMIMVGNEGRWGGTLNATTPWQGKGRACMVACNNSPRRAGRSFVSFFLQRLMMMTTFTS